MSLVLKLDFAHDVLIRMHLPTMNNSANANSPL